MQILATPRRSALRCAFCHDVAEATIACEGCETRLHPECRALMRGCLTLGCRFRRLRTRTVVRVAPPSEPVRRWWGWLWIPVVLGLSLGVLSTISGINPVALGVFLLVALVCLAALAIFCALPVLLLVATFRALDWFVEAVSQHVGQGPRVPSDQTHPRVVISSPTAS